MLHVKADEREAIEVAPGLFGLKLIDGSRGSADLSLLRGWLKPGAQHGLHSHPMEEVVLFLSGRGVVEIDGRRYDVAPGDSMCFPPHTPHSTVNNDADEDLVFVATFSDNLISSLPLGTPGNGEQASSSSFRSLLNRLRWLWRRTTKLAR